MAANIKALADIPNGSKRQHQKAILHLHTLGVSPGPHTSLLLTHTIVSFNHNHNNNNNNNNNNNHSTC